MAAVHMKYLNTVRMLLSGTVCADDFLPDVLFLTAFNRTTQPAKLLNFLLFASRSTEISLQPSEASSSSVIVEQRGEHKRTHARHFMALTCTLALFG